MDNSMTKNLISWFEIIAEQLAGLTPENCSSVAADMRIFALSVADILRGQNTYGSQAAVATDLPLIKALGNVKRLALQGSDIIDNSKSKFINTELERVYVDICRALNLHTVCPILDNCSCDGVFDGTLDGCTEFVRHQRIIDPSKEYIIVPI